MSSASQTPGKVVLKLGGGACLQTTVKKLLVHPTPHPLHNSITPLPPVLCKQKVPDPKPAFGKGVADRSHTGPPWLTKRMFLTHQDLNLGVWRQKLRTCISTRFPDGPDAPPRLRTISRRSMQISLSGLGLSFSSLPVPLRARALRMSCQ